MTFINLNRYWRLFTDGRPSEPALAGSLPNGREPAKIQSIAKTLTADDILPLVASLTPRECVCLPRLIALPQDADASVYRSVPRSRDEFSADEEPLAWDAEGWEDVG
jgi:hypothetical protein